MNKRGEIVIDVDLRVEVNAPSYQLICTIG